MQPETNPKPTRKRLVIASVFLVNKYAEPNGVSLHVRAKPPPLFARRVLFRGGGGTSGLFRPLGSPPPPPARPVTAGRPRPALPPPELAVSSGQPVRPLRNPRWPRVRTVKRNLITAWSSCSASSRTLSEMNRSFLHVASMSLMRSFAFFLEP